MSEIRTTTAVTLLGETVRESFTCLATVVAGGIGIAARASRAATSMAVTGSRAVVENARLANNHNLTMSAVAAAVSNAPTARDALSAVAAAGNVEIPREHASALAARLENIVARNDKAALAREVRSVIAARQERTFAAMLPMVVQACETVGYRPERIDARRGRVIVRGEGTERGVLDIAKDKEGGVKLHFDTDGFEGDECAKKLVEPVIRHLHSQGAKCGTQLRTPKRKNVYDRARVGHRLVCRNRR